MMYYGLKEYSYDLNFRIWRWVPIKEQDRNDMAYYKEWTDREEIKAYL